MPNTLNNLWPAEIGTVALPAPVIVLRDQSAALESSTDGKLYSEVLQSSLPSTKTATYDFFVGVTNKAYRHKLFSIKIDLLSDYPVTIYNHEAGTMSRVSEERFPQEIQRILSSEAARYALSRLLGFASQ